MNDTFKIEIDPDLAGSRLDKVLAQTLPDISRSRLKALIQEGHVALSEAASATSLLSPSRTVKQGEVFVVTIPVPEDAEPQAENIPLDIVFEDEHLIVVNKAPGMVVHPAAGSPSGTLVNALLYHCKGSLSGIGGVKRPGIVHRIDKDTSGLLVVAKHDKAHNGLAEQFADHSIERLYTAVCKGHPMPPQGRIEGNIARHPVDRKRMAVSKNGGKWAATHYKTLSHFAQNGTPIASLIRCKLETGRTHQVRVHMAYIGHPLVGDPVYARSSVPGSIKGVARAALLSFKRQALHARTLGFRHPITGEVFKFESELPYDMKELLETLAPFEV